jgi:hypothetical protein
MNQLEMRKAIAELCGWQRVENGQRSPLRKHTAFAKTIHDGGFWFEPGVGAHYDGRLLSSDDCLPYYTTDLNAIQKAERLLVEDWGHYFGMLARLSVVERGQPPYDGPVSVATQILWLTEPDIRAEALCRIFDKWKD